jgi:hypothetical protein
MKLSTLIYPNYCLDFGEGFTSSTGGLCRVEGKYVLLLNSKVTVKEKIQVMIKALQQFDLSDIYVKPAIRELLEGYEE